MPRIPLLLFVFLLQAVFSFGQDSVQTRTLPKALNSSLLLTWGDLRYDSQLNQVLMGSRLRQSIRWSENVEEKNVLQNFDRILDYCENHGYPFARLFFDSLQNKDDRISGLLCLRLGPEIFFDSIRIQEPSPVHRRFLLAYIGIKEGEVYQERLVQSMERRLDELPFVKRSKPSRLLFQEEGAELLLSLDRKSANRFDGLIGLQPSNQVGGKATLIGQVQLSLLNSFRRAERLDFEFRAQPNQTRDLKLYGNFPYFFGLPFGVDAGVDFRRQDTSFSQFNRELGLSYLRTVHNYIKISYRRETSNLLSTEAYEGGTTLPPVLDVSKNAYALQWNWEQLDYRINPRQGFSFWVRSQVGFRSITKNAALNDTLYDNLKLKSNQYLLSGQFSSFIPLFKRSVIAAKLSSSWLVSEQLFVNELFRIGGINTLRGFDEESIFASAFGIINLEYRFLFDKNSFIRLLNDYAISENPYLSSQRLAYSVGVGAQIETNLGLLQINYAVGAQNNAGFDLRRAKVHFGIINYF